ncbi:MAG: putative peptide modification system cyclase, partial [Dokdonella sp.]
GLVERLGDRAGAELIRKHDRLARTIADRHGGREIDKTDGFLMMFERPIQAVAFALDYQRGLKQLNAAENATLASRVGIHVGDVVVWDNDSEDIAKGAKPFEVEGLVKPIASRLMTLALPGQILLSNIAYALAHRAQGELGIQLDKVRWRTHGRYRFRGIPDPVPVFEVGEDGVAPLKAPPWSSKAHREVPFWRRPATMVIEGLVVLALLVIPLVMFLRPEPAIAFANRDWVVVGNLQNLTGESVFDEALESALRIGLEQSRYVNVLPDLKVRDTVTRMQRDPDTTRVDRAVGSEVAIRDGAKALILPTIAEIGGRVRITAEVIDPHTQTTVYSESADGTGAESVLPSLDAINSRLRVRLGEALATVSQDSLPLEKVATKNLDALRAYSLGSRNQSRGQFSEALELYRQALSIDPEFASANMRIATAHASAMRLSEAQQAFEAALANRGRLTPRDILYAEAWLSTLWMSGDTFTKWAVLTETYPDYFPASGGYAYTAWRDANRFDGAIVEVAESSASTRNPMPLPAKHLLGILYLGNERYADAQRVFTDAEVSGLRFTL